MTKPITPKEAQSSAAPIPDAVIECFNELIRERLYESKARIKQCDAVARICSKMNVPASKVYANHWLDVERSFELAGWHVEYDKPGFNETYEAIFEFTVKP